MIGSLFVKGDNYHQLNNVNFNSFVLINNEVLSFQPVSFQNNEIKIHTENPIQNNEDIKKDKEFQGILVLIFIVILLLIFIVTRFMYWPKEELEKMSIKSDEKKHKESLEDFILKEKEQYHLSLLEKGIGEEDKALMKKVKELMETDRIYKDSSLTLDILADKLNITRNHLSKVINCCTGNNFNQYVNEYRIEEAIRLITDPKISNKSMDYIIDEIGFNSRSSFYIAFKKITGVSPSEYKNKPSSE